MIKLSRLTDQSVPGTEYWHARAPQGTDGWAVYKLIRDWESHFYWTYADTHIIWCVTIRWHTFELLQWLDLALPGIEFLCPIWTTSSPCNSHSSLGIKLIQSLCFGRHLCLDNLWNISIMQQHHDSRIVEYMPNQPWHGAFCFLKNMETLLEHLLFYLTLYLFSVRMKSWMANHSHSTQLSTHT